MSRTGRPRIVIETDDFEKLCKIQCTLNEIAGWFNCSIDTIENWCKRTYKTTFSDIYIKKSAGGKISLRRMQWKSAEAGNTGMQVWLGKQYLNQRENRDIQINDLRKIEIIDDLPEDNNGLTIIE